MASSGAPAGNDSLLVINNFSAFRHEAALFVSAVGSGNAGAVTSVESMTSERVSLSFVVPFVPGHRYYGAAPAATVSAPAGWTGGTLMGSGPWTYTFLANTPGPAAAGSSRRRGRRAAERHDLVSGNAAAEANTPDFAFTFIALSDAGSGANSPQSITVNASAPSGAGSESDDA